MNFYSSKDLACTEIRAYHLSNVCLGQCPKSTQNLKGQEALFSDEMYEKCIFHKTERSLSVADSTKFIEQNERLKIISSIMQNCMRDESPLVERRQNLA